MIVVMPVHNVRKDRSAPVCLCPGILSCEFLKSEGRDMGILTCASDSSVFDPPERISTISGLQVDVLTSLIHRRVWYKETAP